MESRERHDEGQDRPADDLTNVVRIPRDWFGPVEELVPFGPRTAEADVPVDPNSFWDESSGSIQHVVGAPRDAVRHERRRLARTRTLAAAVVVAVIVGASVAGTLLGSSRPPELRSAIASVNTWGVQLPARHLGSSIAPTTAKRVVHAPPKPSHRAIRETSTLVEYRASQTTSSYEPAKPAASTTTGYSASGSGTTAPSPTSVNQPSQPAFGAAGALGPMSSPDG